MKGTRSVPLACLLALVCLAGCSSSSSPSQQAIVEGRVEEVMAVVIPILEAMRNLAFPTPQGVTCSEVGGPYCMEGSVEQCETTFNFTDCCASSIQGSICVNGTLTYSAESDWPSGQRTVDIDSTQEGSFSYDMTFVGSATATVIVTGDDLLATCDVDLDSGNATCEVA